MKGILSRLPGDGAEEEHHDFTVEEGGRDHTDLTAEGMEGNFVDLTMVGVEGNISDLTVEDGELT